MDNIKVYVEFSAFNEKCIRVSKNGAHLGTVYADNPNILFIWGEAKAISALPFANILETMVALHYEIFL